MRGEVRGGSSERAPGNDPSRKPSDRGPISHHRPDPPLRISDRPSLQPSVCAISRRTKTGKMTRICVEIYRTINERQAGGRAVDGTGRNQVDCMKRRRRESKQMARGPK